MITRKSFQRSYDDHNMETWHPAITVIVAIVRAIIMIATTIWKPVNDRRDHSNHMEISLMLFGDG